MEVFWCGFLTSNADGAVGVYPVRPQLPAVGGLEGVGEVYSVGSAVKGLCLVMGSSISDSTLFWYLAFAKFYFAEIIKDFALILALFTCTLKVKFAQIYPETFP